MIYDCDVIYMMDVCMSCLWCRLLLNQVLERHALTSEEKARVLVLQQQTAASKMGTAVNKNWKAQISVLFSEFDKLTALIDLFRGIFIKTLLKLVMHVATSPVHVE